jgi:hypothetical protein
MKQKSNIPSPQELTLVHDIKSRVDPIGFTIYVMMNEFGFILNFKRNRKTGRWVEDDKNKCKGRASNTKDNNDFLNHNSAID